MKYSDDGEPQGTAGVPILEVLKRENIKDVLCVVTRYFGGTLLGAGGLARAYSGACKLALTAAGLAVMKPYIPLSVRADYRDYQVLLSLAQNAGYQLSDAAFGENVAFNILVPGEQAAGFQKKITEVTAARADVSLGDCIMKPEKMEEKEEKR